MTPIKKWPVYCLGMYIASGAAQAQFAPGRVYISDPGPPEIACTLPGLGDNSRIFQYDPATGAVSTFVIIPDELCGGLTGLAFTPDGAYLRASAASPSAILQIDSDGTVGVALGPGGGLVFPAGSNNIAYGPDGSFYVVNLTGEILKYPPASSTPTVFAPPSSLNNTTGSITVAPNGDVYYGKSVGLAPYIVRFTPTGLPSIFDIPTGSLGIGSLAMGQSGDLFALALTGALTAGVYHYAPGDASSEVLINGALPSQAGTIALSLDESDVYLASGNALRAVDVITGQVTTLATGVGVGWGMAVYVPEPATLPLVSIGLVLIGARSRPRSGRARPCARSIE